MHQGSWRLAACAATGGVKPSPPSLRRPAHPLPPRIDRTADGHWLGLQVAKARPGERWRRLFRGDSDGARCSDCPAGMAGPLAGGVNGVQFVAQRCGEAAVGKGSAAAPSGAVHANAATPAPLADYASGQTALQGGSVAFIGHSATDSAGADVGTPAVAPSPGSSNGQLLDRPHPSHGACAAPLLSAAPDSAVKGAGVRRGAAASEGGGADNTAVPAAPSPSCPSSLSPWREGCPAAYSLHQLQQELVLELQVR